MCEAGIGTSKAQSVAEGEDGGGGERARERERERLGVPELTTRVDTGGYYISFLESCSIRSKVYTLRPCPLYTIPLFRCWSVVVS
jgi:hypothetical protein